ncbi:MAG: hypothetical protein O2805_06235 [Proteobacteria bacterium]|nr:hypothetical protein [Pseudomonadota bacterium]
MRRIATRAVPIFLTLAFLNLAQAGVATAFPEDTAHDRLDRCAR